MWAGGAPLWTGAVQLSTLLCAQCARLPPSCTHSPPQPGSGVHGTFSMASLFNIIICVIQHLPFIYFYLFFWLGNLGSSPDRLCRNLFPHAPSPARPPPASHSCYQGASSLQWWLHGPLLPSPPRAHRHPSPRHINSSNLIKQKLFSLIASWGSFTKRALWPGSCREGWKRQDSSGAGQLPGLR